MSLLAAYYDALGQNALASADESRAKANLTRQQGNLLGSNAAAQQNLEAAQADAARAGATKTGAETKEVAPNAAAARAAETASAGLDTARAQAVPFSNAYTAAQTIGLGLANQAAGFGLGGSALDAIIGRSGGGLATSGGTVQQSSVLPSTSSGINFADPDIQGREKGGVILTKGEAALGKSAKPGPTDTVPAMLTPGEAVLNKGAVQHYGSDVVRKMNQMGLLRMGAQSEVAKAMGMPDPHAPPQTAKRAERKAKQGKSKAA